MNSWIRMASSALMVVAMMCGGTASAHTVAPAQPMRHLTVTVYDYSGVDARTLATAQDVASEVYRRAGIEIEWAEPDGYTDATRLYVNLLSTEMITPLWISKDTVGFATPGALAATAIYDRIHVLAHQRHVPCGVLLGYVIAHEVGHLLLPAHSHSDAGVMMASLNMEQASGRKLRFTNDQAALMLERLTASPAVSTH